MLAASDLRSSAPVPMQRAHGQARVGFRSRAGLTCLDRLFQEGCAKLRFPRPFGAEPPQAILINTAGGLTGGDRFGAEVILAPQAEACLTTQACERIYRSTGADAVVSNCLRLSHGTRLAWLPQETILFDGGRLSRRLDVEMASDAELLAVEAVLFGRAALQSDAGTSPTAAALTGAVLVALSAGSWSAGCACVRR